MAAVAARHSWLMSRVTKDQSSSLTPGIVSFHTRLTAQNTLSFDRQKKRKEKKKCKRWASVTHTQKNK